MGGGNAFQKLGVHKPDITPASSVCHWKKVGALLEVSIFVGLHFEKVRPSAVALENLQCSELVSNKRGGKQSTLTCNGKPLRLTLLRAVSLRREWPATNFGVRQLEDAAVYLTL